MTNLPVELLAGSDVLIETKAAWLDHEISTTELRHALAAYRMRLWSAAERDGVSYAALRRTHAALTVLHACELQLTVTDFERLEAGFETYKPVKSSPDKVSARPETTLCELTAQT